MKTFRNDWIDSWRIPLFLEDQQHNITIRYNCIIYLFRINHTPASAPASQEPERSHAVRYKAITYTAWSENTV